MRYLKSKLIFTVILAVVLLSSCVRDPFQSEPEKIRLGTIACKAKGKEFKTELGTAVYGNFQGNGINNIFLISGFESLGITTSGLIQITAYIDPSIGIEEITYTTGGNRTNCVPDLQLCWGIIYGDVAEEVTGHSDDTGGAFTISFSRVDFREGGVISGRFSGTVISEETGEIFEISEGIFNLEITGG
ncbi:MAG: hypothetical protein GYB31_01715 [Bacteroidetes bacterium]|nr:hypothetical protein [Bacteroidota bacterium]